MYIKGKHEIVKEKLWIAVGTLAGIYAIAWAAAKKYTEPDCIDFDNPYIHPYTVASSPALTSGTEGFGGRVGGGQSGVSNTYEAYIKPALDKVLSFGGLVILSPLYLMLGVAIYLDDPGTIFFTQKRVGKGGTYFMLHKFRTMKMSTPHDVPTHELKTPET